MIFPSDVEKIVDTKVYIPLLKKWFWDEMAELFGSPSVPSYGLLMGCPLYAMPEADGTLDNDFIDRFFFFCLPSIMGRHNAEVLKNNARIVIFTNGGAENGGPYARFWLMRKDLKKRGIDVVIKRIPEYIMEHVPKNPLNRYWLLGTVQQILLQMASRDEMGFHMLMPDHLYSDHYFPNLFRMAEKHEGLAQTGISADIEKVLPELEQYRQNDGTLEIPDLELGDMGWRNLHGQIAYNTMNNAGDLTGTAFPLSHYLCWQGRDRLYLYCCHMNAVYLSPRVCARAPIRLHNALDTELPYFMPETVQILEAEDGMTFIELSDERKLHQTERVAFGPFAAQAWATVHFKDDYMPFFQHPNTVPIKPQAEYMEEAAIKQAHADIVQSLMNCRDAVKELMQRLDKENAEQGVAGEVLREEATVINFAQAEAAD